MDFNDPDGAYVRGDLYVYALSSVGVYLTNGGFPQLAGQPIDGVNNAAVEPIYDVILSAIDNEKHEGVCIAALIENGWSIDQPKRGRAEEIEFNTAETL